MSDTEAITLRQAYQKSRVTIESLQYEKKNLRAQLWLARKALETTGKHSGLIQAINEALEGTK